MKKTIAVFCAAVLAVHCCGCSGLQKKFTRKKKEAVRMPRIYQEKKYEKKPAAELYQKHFSFWQGWQSELLDNLGANHKKDVRCIEEVITNLSDMADLLIEERGVALKSRIAKIAKARDLIVHEDLTQYNRVYIRRTLEREERAIKRDFTLHKVEGLLKKSSRDAD